MRIEIALREDKIESRGARMLVEKRIRDMRPGDWGFHSVTDTVAVCSGDPTDPYRTARLYLRGDGTVSRTWDMKFKAIVVAVDQDGLYHVGPENVIVRQWITRRGIGGIGYPYNQPITTFINMGYETKDFVDPHYGDSADNYRAVGFAPWVRVLQREPDHTQWVSATCSGLRERWTQDDLYGRGIFAVRRTFRGFIAGSYSGPGEGFVSSNALVFRNGRLMIDLGSPAARVFAGSNSRPNLLFPDGIGRVRSQVYPHDVYPMQGKNVTQGAFHGVAWVVVGGYDWTRAGERSIEVTIPHGALPRSDGHFPISPFQVVGEWLKGTRYDNAGYQQVSRVYVFSSPFVQSNWPLINGLEPRGRGLGAAVTM